MSVADIDSLDVSGYLRPWEPAATFGEEVRNLILHGIGAKDRSCFDADRNRFITGSIEQLDRFEEPPARSAYAEMQALRRGIQSIL